MESEKERPLQRCFTTYEASTLQVGLVASARVLIHGSVCVLPGLPELFSSLVHFSLQDIDSS